MAQLKDTNVSGNLNVTDEVLTNSVQTEIIKIPVTSGSTTYGPGTAGQVIKSDGTGAYWAADSAGVTSVTIKATSPIAIDSSAAITSTGTRTISHANSGATAGSYGDSTAQTPNYGGTFKVPYVTVNATGHVTGITEHTVKIPASDNTDTKVTSVDNHYAPAEDSTAQLSADASGGAAATWNSTQLVTGVDIKRDAKGHVTGVAVDSIKLPANPNTNTIPTAYCGTAADTAAKTASCTNYKLLANSYIHVLIVNTNTSAGAITLNINGQGAKPIYINGTASGSSNYGLTQGTYLVYYNGTNYYFRTDGKVTTSGIVDIGGNTAKFARGDGTWQNVGTVTNVSLSAGTGMSVTGSPISTTGTITVTNTAPHVDGKNIVGNASTATANATTATTNTTTFLNHIENTTVKSYTQIKGAGGTTVAAQSGVVTITGLSIGTTAATAMAGNTAVNKVNVSVYSPGGASTYVYPTFATSGAIDTNTTLRYNKYLSCSIRYSAGMSTRRYIALMLGGPSVVDDEDPTIILSSAVYGATRYYTLNNGYATIRANADVSTSATHTLGTTTGTIVDDGDIVTDNVNRPILLANCSTGSTPGTAPLTNRNNNIYANGSTGKIGCKGLTGTTLSIDTTASLSLNGGTSGTSITGENVTMNAGSGYSLSAAYATLVCSQYMEISSGLTDENDSGITIEGYHVTINDQSSTNTVNIGTQSYSTINMKGSAIKINSSTTSNNSVTIGSTSYSTTEIEGKTVSINSNVSSGQGSVSISALGPNGGSISLNSGSGLGKITVGGGSGIGTVTIEGTGTSGKVNITAKSWTSSSATTAGIDSNGKLVKVSSARRYKDYIDYDIDKEDYHNQLMAFEPCTYEYKELPGEQNLGFIADDIYEINPQLVNYNDDFEIESYRDKDITAMLIMEAQRKDQEITELKQQINDLQYLVNQLLNGQQDSLWN